MKGRITAVIIWPRVSVRRGLIVGDEEPAVSTHRHPCSCWPCVHLHRAAVLSSPCCWTTATQTFTLKNKLQSAWFSLSLSGFLSLSLFSLSPSLCLALCLALSLSLSVSLSFSPSLFNSVSVCLSICLSVCLSDPSVFLSFCLSVSLSSLCELTLI